MTRAALLALSLALTPSLLAAQSRTSSAIRGTVLQQDSTPVAGALISVTARSHGRRSDRGER